MNKIVKSIVVILIGAITFSCSTTNDVAGKFGIQKRKYNKGFSISKSKRYKTNKSSETLNTKVNEEILADNNQKTTKTKTVETTNSKVNTNVSSSTTSEQLINAVEKTNITSFSPIEKTSPQANKVTLKETIKTKAIKKIIKKKVKKSVAQFKSETSSDDEILYYILAILVPFLAVGLVTDWDITKVLICLLLTLLCYIPGLIYALITVKDNV